MHMIFVGTSNGKSEMIIPKTISFLDNSLGGMLNFNKTPSLSSTYFKYILFLVSFIYYYFSTYLSIYYNSIQSQTLQLIKNCCGNCVIMTLCTMKRMRKIWEYVKYKRLCLLTFIFFVCAYFFQFPYRCHSVLW